MLEFSVLGGSRLRRLIEEPAVALPADRACPLPLLWARVAGGFVPGRRVHFWSEIDGAISNGPIRFHWAKRAKFVFKILRG